MFSVPGSKAGKMMTFEAIETHIKTKSIKPLSDSKTNYQVYSTTERVGREYRKS